jgi:hypothetical protein
MSPSSHPRPPRGRLVSRLGPPLLSLASLLVALALAEGAFALLLSQPALLRHLPANVKRHLRNYYLAYDRDLIQADPRSSRYDPELFYTLRPGAFRFRGREFDVAFAVNSLGVRDSEDALRASEVIVAGDSFAMGWGVEADETFASRVRQRTGLRVLNTGVSSYGTARELLLLRRVDTRHMRFLLIQYDRNDAWENAALERHGGSLPMRPRERFEHTLLGSSRKRRYWPGRHAFEIVRAVVHPRREPLEEPVPAPDAQARLFLHALRALLPSGDYDVIVFELSPAAPPDDAFARELRAQVARPDGAGLARRLHVLELGRVLRPEHFFDLDDHLRASGHALVGDELAKALARVGVGDD